mmetsp:Transcript_47295/g.109444  ORF Transcript_47295/g.109444 Transcript_47295/m.109444 type:complete len:744 (+) Transcript_47295:65-2296(+)
MLSSHPQPFADLIAKLHEVHREELRLATEDLRKENRSLKAQLRKLRAANAAAEATEGFRGKKAVHHWDVLMGQSEATATEKICQASSDFQRSLASNIFRAPSNVILRVAPPNNIDLAGLCAERFPDRNLQQLCAWEVADLMRHLLKPSHCLLDPRSHLVSRWDLAMAAALTFVGMVTPYEVVFLPSDSRYWGLFIVNRFVDVFFVIDLIMQFFLQVEVQRPGKGGSVLLKDPIELRKRYLKSWFAIDVISLVPFEAFSLLVGEDGSDTMRQAKILRCVKLLRVLKLLRILRTSRLMQRWKDKVDIPFATQRLIKFCASMVLVSHWMACLWGVVGLTVGEALCDGTGHALAFESLRDVPVGHTSWVTTLYLDGKHSPDSPCNHFEVYIASLHWAVMTITSIGYGDIVPVRVEEYIVGTICMLVGGVLWAYIIGCVTSIMSNVSPVEANFEERTDLLNRVMKEASLPETERHTYREYLREAKAYDRKLLMRRAADNLSPLLRKHLLHFVNKDALESVSYFKDAPAQFLVDVSMHLSPGFFSRWEPLESVSDSLCMLEHGTVVDNCRIMVPPRSLNEDFLLVRRYRKPSRAISLTYSMVLFLTRSDMAIAVQLHPEFAAKIRKAALWKAVFRAVMSVAKKHRHACPFGGGEGPLPLSVAFAKYELDLLSAEGPEPQGVGSHTVEDDSHAAQGQELSDGGGVSPRSACTGGDAKSTTSCEVEPRPPEAGRVSDQDALPGPPAPLTSL